MPVPLKLDLAMTRHDQDESPAPIGFACRRELLFPVGCRGTPRRHGGTSNLAGTPRRPVRSAPESLPTLLRARRGARVRQGASA